MSARGFWGRKRESGEERESWRKFPWLSWGSRRDGPESVIEIEWDRG